MALKNLKSSLWSDLVKTVSNNILLLMLSFQSSSLTLQTFIVLQSAVITKKSHQQSVE